jgi:hypothetical protein
LSQRVHDSVINSIAFAKENFDLRRYTIKYINNKRRRFALSSAILFAASRHESIDSVDSERKVGGPTPSQSLSFARGITFHDKSQGWIKVGVVDHVIDPLLGWIEAGVVDHVHDPLDIYFDPPQQVDSLEMIHNGSLTLGPNLEGGRRATACFLADLSLAGNLLGQTAKREKDFYGSYEWSTRGEELYKRIQVR